MSLYEGMFMMDNRQANRDWDGALAALTDLIVKHGGEIVRTVKWGERRLAYDIDGRRRATYVLVYFNCTGDGVNRIYRECELAEGIHRALILKITELPPEDAPRGDEIPDRPRDRSRGPGRGRRAPTAQPERREERTTEDSSDEESEEKDISEDSSDSESGPEEAPESDKEEASD